MRIVCTLVGFTVGWWSAIAWVIFFAEPSAAEAARNFAAYRACIQRSDCMMTPQDWIDYYDLKWRLEEKDIERPR